MPTESELAVQRGGDGEPILLLLHGLGATSEVWRGLGELLGEKWPGAWLAPDLPGHGHSKNAVRYSFGSIAAQLAALLPTDRRVVVLGHSLGGVLALTLASGWFGVKVAAACGLGIKVEWSEEELGKAAELAARPSRVFESRGDAAKRWLLVSGLQGLWDSSTPSVNSGIRATGEGWEVALDQRAFGIGAPDMTGLLFSARGEIILAAGERDPMCTADQLRDLKPDPVILPGLGHNAHVEDPSALWPILERLLNACK